MLLPADKTVGAFLLAHACMYRISATFPPQIGANSFQMASFGITDEYKKKCDNYAAFCKKPHNHHTSQILAFYLL